MADFAITKATYAITFSTLTVENSRYFNALWHSQIRLAGSGAAGDADAVGNKCIGWPG
ncbi:hypothetical protein [Cupriavidus oxalaticus]|uniref:hypothetical protein n=1 Tax=Cupriavidus oxalaticus TaxID=96344 RepID=UPI00142E953B|nr:hypothetical protein [Cupriavidus oxalaticus]